MQRLRTTCFYTRPFLRREAFTQGNFYTLQNQNVTSAFDLQPSSGANGLRQTFQPRYLTQYSTFYLDCVRKHRRTLQNCHFRSVFDVHLDVRHAQSPQRVAAANHAPLTTRLNVHHARSTLSMSWRSSQKLICYM